jgi:2-oxoisovalerate dehydrogenase E2 component (dihydrolipoyl transacylase)
MGSYIFKLPDLGEGTVESEIVQWRVAPGDVIEAEQPLVDMMTDKATVEITSPVGGRVVRLAGEPGDRIAVGADLVEFDTGAAAVPPPSTPVHAVPVAPEPVAPAAASPARKALASPAVRRRAREAGVDLAAIPGTGPGGRVTRADLEAATASATMPATSARETSAATAPAISPAPASPPGTRRTGVQEVKLAGLRRRIAEQMVVASQHIPHFTYVEEVDVTELDALRRHLNDTQAGKRPTLTFLPFFMRAIVRVLADFPHCNAHFDDGKGIMTRFEAVHMGIATQTPQGLMVPVVRHAEALDLWQSAAEVKRVTDAARSGKATRDELTGSTITLTSLGALGGIVSTPIINHPEVAIIGVNKVQQRPVYVDGVLVPRHIMNLSSSFDHRIVDGHDAARMIQAVKALLEHPATLFI